MKNYYEAPNKANLAKYDHCIFLAGGITDCPDWQAPVRARLNEELPPLIVFNPRREHFDVSKKDKESVKQIVWEHTYLARANIVMFWFPKESICPITLLELGKFLMKPDTQLYVGTDPAYSRRLDVEVQTKLERPNVKVWDNLENMITQIIEDHKADDSWYGDITDTV